MMTDIRSLHDTSHSDSLQNKTDFSLCIKCQVAEGTLLNSPQPESRTKKFLEAVTQHAELDDGNFPAISHMLQHSLARLNGTVTVTRTLSVASKCSVQ